MALFFRGTQTVMMIFNTIYFGGLGLWLALAFGFDLGLVLGHYSPVSVSVALQEIGLG